eukprot:2696434-Pyramimonas_sp.AAC.1
MCIYIYTHTGAPGPRAGGRTPDRACGAQGPKRASQRGPSTAKAGDHDPTGRRCCPKVLLDGPERPMRDAFGSSAQGVALELSVSLHRSPAAPA